LLDASKHIRDVAQTEARYLCDTAENCGGREDLHATGPSQASERVVIGGEQDSTD
jgi:hypothetical protein